MQSTQQSKAEWFAHAAQWAASGLTRAAYCEQYGLKLHKLAYWVKLSKTQTSSAAPITLVQAKIAPTPPTAQDCLILQCPNGSTLRLPPTTSAAWLGALLCHLS